MNSNIQDIKNKEYFSFVSGYLEKVTSCSPENVTRLFSILQEKYKISQSEAKKIVNAYKEHDQSIYYFIEHFKQYMEYVKKYEQTLEKNNVKVTGDTIKKLSEFIVEPQDKLITKYCRLFLFEYIIEKYDKAVTNLMNQESNKYNNLFVIEGMDFTGKSTLIKSIQENKLLQGKDIFIYKEPVTAPPFEKFYDYLTCNPELDNLTTLNLFMANRSHGIKNILLPALKTDKIVLCDRYWFSTYAYQMEQFNTSPEQFEEFFYSYMELLNPPRPEQVFYIKPVNLEEHINSRFKVSDNLENKDIKFYNNVLRNYDYILSNFSSQRQMIQEPEVKYFKSTDDIQTNSDYICNFILERIK